MAKYITEKQVIELMKDGWLLFPKTNYDNSIILSYWLGKRNEANEKFLTKKTRNSLVDKNIISANDELIK